MERKSAWKRYNEEQLNDLEQFATDYKEFISECKTERECVNRAVSMAKVCGFKNLQEVIARDTIVLQYLLQLLAGMLDDGEEEMLH